MKTGKVSILAALNVLGLAVLLLAACSNAEVSARSAWGQKHHVTLYSGGKVVGEWDSTGKIEDEVHGDGRYFQDAKTGLLVSISGTYVIEVVR